LLYNPASLLENLAPKEDDPSAVSSSRNPPDEDLDETTLTLARECGSPAPVDQTSSPTRSAENKPSHASNSPEHGGAQKPPPRFNAPRVLIPRETAAAPVKTSYRESYISIDNQ
jgi:hypothetical protein